MSATSSSPTSSSSWMTMDDDSDATDATYSPSEASSTSFTSEMPAWQIRSLLSEVECLKRDEYSFSRLPTRPRRLKSERRGWCPGTVLDWVLLLALLSLILFSSCVGIPCLLQQHRQQKEVHVPDFSPTVRPSDNFALSKIAFQLPSRWMEWVALPPLGMSRLKDEEEGARYQLSVLQLYNEGWSRRENIRAQNRKSWARGIKDVGVWLEKIEECSSFLTTEDTDDFGMPPESIQVAPRSDTETACKALLHDANGVKKLASLVNDMLDHLRFELAVVDILYLPTFSNLSLESEAQMRTINVEVWQIAVEAMQRQSQNQHHSLSPVDAKSSPLIRLLTDSDKTRIALARQEYGLLTFLALSSYALPPALLKRKQAILTLQSQIDSSKQRLSAFSNGSCTTPLCVTTVAREIYARLPMVSEFNEVTKERHLSASTIRRSASEWMERHTLAQHDHQAGDNAATNEPLPKTAKPRHHSSLAAQLHHLIWHHPTLGPSSWHWEGSGSCPNHLPSCTNTQLESALLYTDLAPANPPTDYLGLLGKGEKWEDYRYRMMPRKDRADLRVCWPTRHAAPNVCRGRSPTEFLRGVGLV